jgi:hypothetical protein
MRFHWRISWPTNLLYTTLAHANSHFFMRINRPHRQKRQDEDGTSLYCIQVQYAYPTAPLFSIIAMMAFICGNETQLTQDMRPALAFADIW